MPYRLIPREVRDRMGRRGLVLLLFGTAWMIQGAAAFLFGQMGSGGHFLHEQIPAPTLGVLWGGCGLLSIACAPTRRHPFDTLGYIAVSAMPMLYGICYLVGAVAFTATGQYRWALLGGLGFSIWGVIALALAVVASWPEPPVLGGEDE